MTASMTMTSKAGKFFKRFLLSFTLVFALVYLGDAAFHSVNTHQVRFVECYTRNYSIGLLRIESRGVHGSGADFDGFYANAFYGERPLSIRFTDVDPKDVDGEIGLFLLGLACLSFAIIATIGMAIFTASQALGAFKGWTISFEPVSILAGAGLAFCLLAAVPVISFGPPYVNMFVPG